VTCPLRQSSPRLPPCLRMRGPSIPDLLYSPFENKGRTASSTSVFYVFLHPSAFDPGPPSPSLWSPGHRRLFSTSPQFRIAGQSSWIPFSPLFGAVSLRLDPVHCRISFPLDGALCCCEPSTQIFQKGLLPSQGILSTSSGFLRCRRCF